MPWVREGYCCACGECCANAGNPYYESNEPACPHYIATDKTCNIHGQEGTYWAKGCNVWPTKPEHVVNFPSCTYTFRWEE